MLIVGTTLSEVGLRREVGRKALFSLGAAGGVASGLRKLSFERWYRRHYQRERAREKWELENYPKGEREEMTGLFTFKGMSAADAEHVVEMMSTYKEFFVNLMMTEELQLREPTERTPRRAAAVGASYVLAALIPVLVTDLAAWHVDSQNGLFYEGFQRRVFQLTGLFLLALLGARRATMCVLRLKAHVLECLLLGVACILAPQIILALF